jgi:hypothetical protein
MSEVAHLYRVELLGIEPRVWRRIRVPASYSFWDLHVAIQDAMGWLDYHLHLFRTRNPTTGRIDEIGIPCEDGSRDGQRCRAGWETPIAKYFARPNDRANYDYDFGDNWHHTIKLEAIVELEQGEVILACLAGERACPPEDCGGVHGYEHFLRAISVPTHPEHAAMLERVGGDFDPEGFAPDRVRFDDPRQRWKKVFEHAP